MRLVSLLAAFVLVSLAGRPVEACGGEADCAVDGGTYRARPPANWDGTSPLPVLVFFHGYGGSAASVMDDRGMGELLSARGFLLVAPDGRNGGWSIHGLPRERDDVAFVAAVLADVRSRWPVDPSRVWASGFSVGGSMVWELACYAPTGFTAYLPIAGALWDPLPAGCAPGKAPLSHVHGFTDSTVPLEGRPIAGTWHQGDVFASLALLRRAAACQTAPTTFATSGQLACRSWNGCASGGGVRFCLHPLEHDMRPDWLAAQLDWAEAFARPP